MQSYEYKVVPAPMRGEKERGLKTGAEKFAHALTLTMNELAREGWEYWRSETLPAEERSGLTSKTTVYHNLLVFRRPLGTATLPGTTEAMVAVDAMEAAAKRLISAIAPEGRAPRLGPAEEPQLASRPAAAPLTEASKAEAIRAELSRTPEAPRLSRQRTAPDTEV